MVFNWVDFIIFNSIVFSAVIGFIKGFIKEALSLLTWFVAFVVVSKYYVDLSNYLKSFSDVVPAILSDVSRNIISAVLLFIGTLLICTIVKAVIIEILAKAGLSSIDRLLGVLFGIARGVVIVSLILFIVERFTSWTETDAWKDSAIIDQFGFVIKHFIEFFQQSKFIQN